jgi:predicted alpha/beta superfamily hydrolase
MSDTVRYHHKFPSRFLRNRRTLAVYLPPGYGEHAACRYPVFYLHDGQNLFDPEAAFAGVAWAADATADRLIRAGAIEPVILVGIANTPNRLDEYGPRSRANGGPAHSRRYARFVVEEVKLFIDRTYRTLPGRDHTAVGGSSMGGLISLFLARWYPDVFGMCAALSPSLWWERAIFLRGLRGNRGWLRSVRIWLDTGDREGTNPAAWRKQVEYARRLAAVLTAEGRRDGRDFRYLEVPGGEHGEHAWAARFDQVLRFLFAESGEEGIRTLDTV